VTSSPLFIYVQVEHFNLSTVNCTNLITNFIYISTSKQCSAQHTPQQLHHYTPLLPCQPTSQPIRVTRHCYHCYYYSLTCMSGLLVLNSQFTANSSSGCSSKCTQIHSQLSVAIETKCPYHMRMCVCVEVDQSAAWVCLERKQNEEGHHEAEEAHSFRQSETHDTVGEQLTLHAGVTRVRHHEAAKHSSDTSTCTHTHTRVTLHAH
jgi:hypothetical protein